MNFASQFLKVRSLRKLKERFVKCSYILEKWEQYEIRRAENERVEQQITISDKEELVFVLVFLLFILKKSLNLFRN